jgi:plasmid stabilization system protein ParE
MAPAAFPGSPVRVALYREHRILYRITSDGIEIGHVLHQGKDFSQILERFAHLLARRR